MLKFKLVQSALGNAVVAASKGELSVLGALPVVAAVIAQKTGVEIVVGGTQASNVGGKRITIPGIDPSNPYFRALAYGYTEHEAFHGRFSDFNVYAAVASSGTPLRKKLLNIIEDPVIELRGSKDFPGAKSDLQEVVRELVKDGTFAAPKEDEHPGKILCGYVLYRLRHDLVGQTALSGVLQETEAVMRKVFSVGVCVRLAVLLRQAEECTTTQDCLDLADDVLGMLKEEEEKANEPDPPPPPQQGQGSEEEGSQQSPGGSQNQDGAEGQENVQAEGAGNGQSGDDGSAGRSDANGGQEASNGDSAGGAVGATAPAEANPGGLMGTASSGQDVLGGSGAGSDEGGPARQATARALGQALSAGAGDLPKDTFEEIGERLSVAARTGQVERIPDLPRVHDAGADPVLGASRLAKVKATSARLRARMHGLVQSYRHEPARLARSGSRIDVGRLALVSMGEDRVFVRRDVKVAPNTVFHILVDNSDSMATVVKVEGASTPKYPTKVERPPRLIDVACESALALALALEGIPNVSVAVSAFPGVVAVLKRGEAVKAAAKRFTLTPSGGTPMAQGIWHAVVEIAKAPEERKVVMVITDGAPDSKPAVQHIVSRCVRSGVEVIGIGIKTPSVKDLFPVSAVISDAADLRNVIFELARKALMPEAA